MSFNDSLQAAAQEWQDAEVEDGLVLSLESRLSCLDYQDQQLPLNCKRTPGRQQWTQSEDFLLREVSQRYRPDWKKIAGFFPGKPKSAVRRRWENKFDPDIRRAPWTEEEDAAIQKLLAEIGPVWRKIATRLPGRPADMIKNRYYGHIKRLRDIQAKKHLEASVKSLSSPGSEWEALVIDPCPSLLSTLDAQQDGSSHDSHLI